MPKSSTVYVCQQCDNKSPKWAGQCPSCGKWNTLVETPITPSLSGSKFRAKKSLPRLKLAKVSELKPKSISRQTTGLAELDRVLGGGLVPGQVVLVAGEPGIGKSTLLTQLSIQLALLKDSPPVLYVSGEESTQQVSLRVHRLMKASLKKNSNKLTSFLLAAQTNVDAIAAEILAQKKLSLVIVDSIQTLNTSDLSGMAGSVGQVRECAGRLIQTIKNTQTPLFLVGHVTKEGAIAGPRVLEHMVDTVLWFEGDRFGLLRLLRAVKNRFGPTDEVGVFQMTDAGLAQVSNPSEFFLDQQVAKTAAGSAVAVIMEGQRPLLVEVQALVVPSQLAIPRRIGKGIDTSRLNVIVAVLIKRLELRLGKQDVYLNIAGGLKVKEPAADLAIAASIFSAYKNQPVKPSTAFAGEVGLLGEVRPVPQLQNRTKEAKRLGFKQLLSSGELRTLLNQALRNSK